MYKRSLLCLGLVHLGTSSGVALAAGDSDYVSAFGRETDGQTDAAAEVQEKSDAAVETLRDIGSFPVRVRRGDKEGLDWGSTDRRNYVPKPAERKFKAGKCEFRIATGDIGLTRYEFREDTHEVSVNTDPVLRFSTLPVSSTQGLLVSMNAELFVAILSGTEAACKEMFAGRKVRFGDADLAPSDLILERDGITDPAAQEKAQTYRAQTVTPVFITWNETLGRLELFGKAGLPPSVESPVFLVKPRAEGDYYLTVSPKLGLERSKKR